LLTGEFERAVTKPSQEEKKKETFYKSLFFSKKL
jgi:hypothetical protein